MRRRVLLGVALGVVAAALVLVGGASLVQVWQMTHEVKDLEREIRELHAETDRLNRVVDRLREDPALIEQIAREELGLVKEGEKVLKFPAAAR